MDEMLRSCVCFGRNKRRSSSFEDSSSCRSSEIERGGVGNDTQVAHNDSLLKLFRSKGWYRQWRETGRAMSMTKIERSEYICTIYMYNILFISNLMLFVVND